jgi:hypothetical protein
MRRLRITSSLLLFVLPATSFAAGVDMATPGPCRTVVAKMDAMEQLLKERDGG